MSAGASIRLAARTASLLTTHGPLPNNATGIVQMCKIHLKQGNNTDMDAKQFWFFDVAVRAYVPLNWLTAPNIEEILNREEHHLSRTEIICTLLDLKEREHIFFSYSGRDGKDIIVDLSFQDIDSILDISDQQTFASSRRLSYGLTAKGGAAWETITRPEWHKFYEDYHELRDTNVLLETGHSEWRGNFEVFTLIFGMQLLVAFHTSDLSKLIHPGSIQYETLNPWQATYWKTLPKGYRITYDYDAFDGYEEIQHLLWQKPRKPLENWIEDARNWYTPLR